MQRVSYSYAVIGIIRQNCSRLRMCKETVKGSTMTNALQKQSSHQNGIQYYVFQFVKGSCETPHLYGFVGPKRLIPVPVPNPEQVNHPDGNAYSFPCFAIDVKRGLLGCKCIIINTVPDDW